MTDEDGLRYGSPPGPELLLCARLIPRPAPPREAPPASVAEFLLLERSSSSDAWSDEPLSLIASHIRRFAVWQSSSAPCSARPSSRSSQTRAWRAARRAFLRARVRLACSRSPGCVGVDGAQQGRRMLYMMVMWQGR